MTTTLAKGVGRRPREPVRPIGALALSPALFVLLLGGLALRLTIAYVLFPSSGFVTDVASYSAWAGTLAEHGPGGFYANAGFADYPPAYLYVLWLVGALGRVLGSVEVAELVKLPPMLLDLGVAYLLYRLVRGWTWPASHSERLALLAAGLYLVNPVSLYDSALWGQSDAAGALVVLLGLAALVRGNAEGAAALAALAALVKPQFGVVLIPLVLFVLLKRHLLRPGSGPRHPPWAPARLAGWLAQEQGWPRLVTAFIAAWGMFFVVALPFGMGPLEYLERMFGTAGGYGYLTVNAYNLWALVSVDGAPSLATGPAWTEDTLPLLGPLPGVVVGAALLVAGFLWGTLRAAVRDDRWTLLVAVAFLAIAFFILPTRVHERYVFPAVAVMPLLAVMSRRWLLALVLLSVGAFINLHGILTWPIYGSPNVQALPGGEWFRTEPLILTAALLQTGVGLWAAWQLRPGLPTSPDAFDRGGAGKGLGAHGPASPTPGGLGALTPAVDTLGLVDRLVRRLSWGSLRRDRSDSLAAEPGGRLDRKDLLLLVLLVLVTLALRGYRLDQPVRMYFDEVYHARTATEFLQHWEYGEPHDIYEFTHPHLAKYAMAWGIRLAGGNEVTDTVDLGVPVQDAALEPRWTAGGSQEREGDRLYIATGESLAVHDLATDELLLELPVAATAVALDETAHRLYAADGSGWLYRLDTTLLDRLRSGEGDRESLGLDEAVVLFSDGPGGPVDQLLVTDTSVVAVTPGSIATFDAETGAQLSERAAVALTDVLELPWAERLVVDTRQLTDRDAAAEAIADALRTDVPALAESSPLDDAGGREPQRAEIARIARLLDADGTVVVDAYLDEAATEAIEEAIAEGRLPGASLERGPLLAAADANGIELLDAWSLDLVHDVHTDASVSALLLADHDSDVPTLYGATAEGLLSLPIEETGPGVPAAMWMPGAIRDLAWNGSAQLIHALGEAPEGGPTVYVVEPRGQSVFIDVPLPQEPSVLLPDTNPGQPDMDRTRLLALAADGMLTSVEIGGNAFGWRLPGVLLGVLGGALLYLLARVLFARRSIAVIAAILVVAEGMLFVTSRIAMNDVYVTTFILLAVLLFSLLYVRRPRAPTVLVLLLGAGVALGLGLASKWVALYAIGGIGLLVLLRSGLGRMVALGGMLTLTAVLGALAIRPAPVDDPARNWTFLLLMMLLTGLLAAGIVRRPLPLTRAEVVVAAALPVAAGLALSLAGWATAGVLAVGAGIIIASLAYLAASLGRGPFAPGAPLPPTDSPWLRPGPRQVLPWLVTLAALTVLPVAVYVASYSPWVELGNAWGIPVVERLPLLAASTEGGDTLADLTQSMYRYHDRLRAEHAASSPFWAWPLDLKPAWFFSERHGDDTQGLIYDSGNLVIFWMGIAGMAFAAWAAWHRRSRSLAIVVIMWAALWLPWARIDRAAFQYHIYASLPFLLLALAYLLGDLWHGPSARTWFLARATAALALVGAPLLWLLRTPLCVLAGTAGAYPGSVICAPELTRAAQLSQAGVAALVILAVGSGVVAALLWRAWRASGSDRSDAGAARWLAALVIVALVTLGGVAVALALLDSTSATPLELTSDAWALVGLALMAIPAWLTLRARDPRRFVLGVSAAALLWLLLWYPNLSGLPLPMDLAGIYQGLLPTWAWDFQFDVNTDLASEAGLLGADTLVVGAATVVFVLAVVGFARRWGRAAQPTGVDVASWQGTSGDDPGAGSR